MYTSASDMIFFSAQDTTPDGWKETITASKDIKNFSSVNALIRKMVSFATEHNLSGNVWQSWLTCMLMMHENPFSLACERKIINSRSTLMDYAKADLALIRELFTPNPEKMGVLLPMTDFKAPYINTEADRVGCIILKLRERLIRAENTEKFAEALADYYADYGVGIFGLYKAFRISESNSDFSLVPVTDDTDVSFDDLVGLTDQKKLLKQNTEAFLNGSQANNVLLYGDAGTGKSTSIHALMHDYYDQGLRLVELTKSDRRLLPAVMSEIKKRNFHFIICLDDLSFEENESDYKELKAMLEGALEKRSDRILIYATSNRRHLIRETWTDRNDMEYQNDIHHSDTMEEKLSLASRFGLTIYYGKPDAAEYLHIVHELAERQGIDLDKTDLNDRARKWELRHGGMSGRTASQLITWLQGEKACGIIDNISDQ